MSDPHTSVWLTRAELAKRWGLASSTLANWASMGKGPDFMRIHGSRRALYELTEVERFERDQAKVTNSNR